MTYSLFANLETINRLRALAMMGEERLQEGTAQSTMLWPLCLRHGSLIFLSLYVYST